jgi:hypothetical protein
MVAAAGGNPDAAYRLLFLEAEPLAAVVVAPKRVIVTVPEQDVDTPKA